jgi:mono/diheme cytochrome c family protein
MTGRGNLSGFFTHPLQKSSNQPEVHLNTVMRLTFVVLLLPLAAPAQDSNPAASLTANPVYQQNCAACHGRLDQPASAIAKRFYPNVPQLLPPGKGVTDDPVGATHWVVKNGIRFSAMPSFEAKLTDEEIWQVSLFLRSADKLPPKVQEAFRQQDSS